MTRILPISIVWAVFLSIASFTAQSEDSAKNKIYRVKVQLGESATGNSDAAVIEHEEISTRNTQTAFTAAMQACENERMQAQLGRNCEPVSVDGENIATATALRRRSIEETSEPKLSLFHHVSNKGSVYIYGSVHLMKKNAYPLNPKIIAAFAASDNLVLEVNINAIPPETLQQEFRQRGIYSDGSTLNTTLSADTLASAQAVLQTRGLNLDNYQSLKPWLFEQTIINQEMLLYGFDPESGIDSYFDQRARAQGKSILQLETLEQQLSLLSGTPLPVQEASLRYTLDALKARVVQQQLNDLVVDWMQGDVDELYDYMMEPLQEYPELEPFLAALFDDRNESMSRKIGRWMDEGGDYFVIVGAGHLGGANGVVNLLRSRGYKLQQLTP
ncbi:MAG: TraB/GumN family protein [Pseudomonadales bacterium]